MRPYFRKIFSITKKIFIVLFVYTLVSGLFMYFMNKDKVQTKANPILENRKQLYAFMNDPELNKTKEGKESVKIITSIVCSVLGEGCTANPSDGDKNFQSSIFGHVATYVSMPYTNPPASGVYWASGQLEKAGFIPNTYAAGIGFYSLASFQPLWSMFRNASYILLVIFIIAVGFMIMFRVKINPQTVIGIENSLPRIVTTLLFITFSYAIAGFLVDLMYVFLLLAFELFGTTGIPELNPGHLQDLYLNASGLSFGGAGSAFTVYYSGLMGLYGMIPGEIRLILNTMFFSIWTFKFMGAAVPLLKDLVGQIQLGGGLLDVSLRLGSLLAFAVSLYLNVKLAPIAFHFIFLFVTVVGLVFLYFRIFFLLIAAYIQIILNLIFAPIFILPNILPGNNSFVSWFRRMIANLLVFPLVIILLIVLQGIQELHVESGNASIIGTYSGTPTFGMPLLQNFNTSSLVTVITASMLFMIPQLVRSFVKPIMGDVPLEPGAGTLFAGVSGGASQLFGKYHALAVMAPYMKFPFAQKMLGMVGLGGHKNP